jgi:hypothetical protein
VYPPKDFRVEWGPIFHRGRLDGSARVVIIGQDPAAHEAISRRILVGEAGQRIQGFLAKLGVDRSYVLVNTFLYSVFGQGGGERHKDDPKIAAYRNKWLDALVLRDEIEAVISLGRLADLAYQAWRATPKGATVDVAYEAITHPTFPESSSSSGQTTKAEAMAKMLTRWNEALTALAPVVAPDEARPLRLYGTTIADDELAPIHERDLPAGSPPWMGAIQAWASRQAAGEAAGPTATPIDVSNAKRATIVVRVPRPHRHWPDIEP